jgi:hypothetical protein
VQIGRDQFVVRRKVAFNWGTEKWKCIKVSRYFKNEKWKASNNMHSKNLGTTENFELRKRARICREQKGNSQLRPAFPLLEETFCTFQMRFKRVFPLACLFEFFPEHQRSVRFFVILT